MTTKRRNFIVVCLKKFYERGYKRESKDFDFILNETYLILKYYLFECLSNYT